MEQLRVREGALFTGLTRGSREEPGLGAGLALMTMNSPSLLSVATRETLRDHRDLMLDNNQTQMPAVVATFFLVCPGRMQPGPAS